MYRNRLYILGMILFVVSAGCAEVIETQPQSQVTTVQATETPVSDGDTFRKQQMQNRVPNRGGMSGGGMSGGQMPEGAGPDLNRMQQMRNKMFGGAFVENTKDSQSASKTADPNGLISQGRKLFEEKKYESAAVEFENFLRDHEFDDLSPEALYYLGESHYRLENYQAALNAYKKINKIFPIYPLAPDALYRTAKCYEKLNQPEISRSILKRLKAKYPQFDSTKYEEKG